MNIDIPPERIDTVVRSARRRQRLRRILLGFFAAMTAANVVFAAYMLAGAGGRAPAGMLPALALTAISALLLWRIWRTGRREFQRVQALAQPGATAIEQAVAATRAHISELRRFRFVVIAVVLPLFAVAVAALHAQGRMQVSHVAGFGVLLAVVVAGLLVVIRHRLTRQLEPQLQRLAAILGQFEMRA